MKNNSIKIIDYVKSEVILKKDFIEFNKLKPHEYVLPDRLKGLENYIKSLHPYIILPSIIVSSNSFTIIDGHHRYYALQKLKIKKCPVTIINYNSNYIVTDINNGISKHIVLESARKKELLKPKSTAHHIALNNLFYPLILLSDLTLVNK